MINVSEIKTNKPQKYETLLQEKVYAALESLDISYERVETDDGFESIPRTRFVRIFSRFQRVSISSFRPAVKPKPFDR
ncbi:TPA: hypothetical protein ACSPFU_002537 [Enterococcus faecium]